MRLRNIKGSREAIAAAPFVIHQPEEWKGKWPEFWNNTNPLYIEIGMGKGQFLMQHARQHPNINYIGIEKYSSVLLRAIEKAELEHLPNLRFLRFDAEYITNIFAKHEVEKIYLNFSDPWPKERHAKRRLTSRQFLTRYAEILAVDGTVEFKTDNRALFDFSLTEAEETGWKIAACTYDLHQDPVLNENNCMTEYEERFSSLGNPIHKLMICRDEAVQNSR